LDFQRPLTIFNVFFLQRSYFFNVSAGGAKFNV
jgi:hypothetical protein